MKIYKKSIPNELLLDIWKIINEKGSSRFDSSCQFPNLKRKYFRWYFRGLIVLRNNGYIKSVNSSSNKIYVITQRGFVRIAWLRLFELPQKSVKSGEWDYRWRIVCYDIPERKKEIRDILRGLLIKLGFMRYQKSIWISPLEIPNEFKELIKELSLDRWVRVIITDNIDGEKTLMKRFFKK